jgi:3-oxoacyl-[acyl-carrier protein] reductase
MDLGLENKVALIAGGSSGLGLAAARELAREGADVAIGARDPERLSTAEKSLREVARGRVHSTSVDITDLDAARAWVDDVAAAFGALHVVVVSGGSPPMGTASRFTTEEYRQAVDTVLLPAINLAGTALPHLRSAGWGRLLFVASETITMQLPMLTLSAVTRTALARYAQSLAAEVGREGITVNVLAPGATRTEMVERAAGRLSETGDVERQLRVMGEHSAVGRVGTAEEFGAVVAFLAGERASYVTGGVHLVDGGGSVSGLEHRYLASGDRETLA